MPNKTKTNQRASRNRQSAKPNKAPQRAYSAPLANAIRSALVQPVSTGRSKSAPMKRKGNATSTYINSIRNSDLALGLHLPVHDYTRSYMKNRSIYQYTPVADADGGFSLAMNPWLAAFTDNLYYETVLGGAYQKNWIPAVMTNTAATPAGSFPTSTTYVNQLPTNGVFYSTSAADGFSAYVRVTGVKFSIRYFGKLLDAGALIKPLFNHMSLSFVHQAAGIPVGNTAAWSPGLKSDANNSETSKFCNLEREFSWVWRPADLSFHKIQSWIGVADGIAGNLDNDTIVSDGYVSDADANGPCPNGWAAGFIVQPSVLSEVSNYSVEIQIDSDYSVYVERSSSAGIQSTTNFLGNVIPHNDSKLTNLATQALSVHRHALSSHANTMPGTLKVIPGSHHDSLLKEIENAAATVGVTKATEALENVKFF